MTSKELFKKWKEYIEIESALDRCDINELEQIEKNLEVLEILKKMFDKHWLTVIKDNNCFCIFKPNDYYNDDSFCITADEFVVLKRWLENGR